jgi:hypothetical protein
MRARARVVKLLREKIIQKITPFLMFAGRAEEAMNYYTMEGRGASPSLPQGKF